MALVPSTSCCVDPACEACGAAAIAAAAAADDEDEVAAGGTLRVLSLDPRALEGERLIRGAGVAEGGPMVLERVAGVAGGARLSLSSLRGLYAVEPCGEPRRTGGPAIVGSVKWASSNVKVKGPSSVGRAEVEWMLMAGEGLGKNAAAGFEVASCAFFVGVVLLLRICSIFIFLR